MTDGVARGGESGSVVVVGTCAIGPGVAEVGAGSSGVGGTSVIVEGNVHALFGDFAARELAPKSSQ